MSQYHQLPVPEHVLRQEIRIHSLFRVMQSAVIVAILLVPNRLQPTWDPVLGEVAKITAYCYLVLNLGAVVFNYLRTVPATIQFGVGILLDIAFANVFLYAAPGSVGIIALILLFNVAASAIMLSLRFGMLSATLASLTFVLQRQLHADVVSHTAGPSIGSISPFVLIYFSLSLYTVAFIAGRIAHKFYQAGRTAREQGEEIAQLATINDVILQRLPTGVLVVNREGDIEAFNEASARLLGMKAEALGRRSLLLSHTELGQRFAAWSTGKADAGTTITMGPDDTSITPQFLRLTEHGDDSLVFLEDTSQATKQAETITLSTLGRFSASLAHEIRNPLSAISYSTQLLGESHHLDVMDRKMLDIVRQQVQRMNGIIESVLGLARRERAKPESFDLIPMLRDFDAEYRLGFPLDADTLTLQVPPGPLMVHADPKQVHQVIMVLVSNARYYGRMPNEPAQMLIRVNHSAAQTAVDVVDRGPGIPEKALRNLFRPFYTTSSHGTGLGLYIARELMRSNDGDLEYLRLGGSTCFRITLPNAPAA